MAQQEKWDALEEEEESLSLSDLPEAVDKVNDDECDSSDAANDFEFRISVAGGLLSIAADTDMCAADEVFFQGQILPLRPSIGSDSGFFSASPGPSRGGSRSDSLDQYSSTILDLGSNSTSRSNSGSSSTGSSRCVSRSHSSSSRSSSSTCEHPRASLSNTFYGHPSPKPQVRFVRKANARRKSGSSAPPGWGIFRLGIAKVPEIELYDVRSRRWSSGSTVTGRKSNAESSTKCSAKPCSTKDHEACGRAAKAQKKATPRPVGRRFSCRCSPDVVEPIAISKLTIRK